MTINEVRPNYPSELVTWWRAHQKFDRKRKAEEAAIKRAEVAKERRKAYENAVTKKALSKLTTEEIVVLQNHFSNYPEN